MSAAPAGAVTRHHHHAAPRAAKAAVKTAVKTAGKPHAFPSIGYEKVHRTACSSGTTCSKLTFHGGTVQHGETDYQIFWMPSGYYMPSSYRSGLSTWISNVATEDYTAHNTFSVAQQYYDLTGPGSTKSFVPYAFTNAGAIIDTDAFPASGCTDSGTTVCITDAQIQAEIQKVVTAHSLPQNENTDYTLFTPLKVGSCFTSASASCAYTSYCAYHNYFTGTSGQIVYQNMPWAYGVSGCDVNDAFGAGYANASAIDPVVGVWSHELIETMTDPNLNAWIDSSGYEIGDKCAYIYGSGGYGSMTGLANNGLGYWNLNLAGGEYLLQEEFSNQNSNGTSTGCELRDTTTQPSVSVSIVPNPPVHGSSSTFTAHMSVSDPTGVNQVLWTFGDGASANGQSVPHTYASAGTYTLTMVLTDGIGNEARVTEKVTVS